MSQIQRKQLLDLKSQLADQADALEAISQVAEDEGRNLSDEDIAQQTAITAEVDKLTGQVDSLENVLATKEKIAQRRMITGDKPTDQPIGKTIPAKAAVTKSRYFKDNYTAYAMGQWIGAALMGRHECKQWCRDHGVGAYKNAMEEGTDTLGGFTVPTPLAATIIELFEQWGVFRQYARNVPMTSETLRVPRLDGSLTVYYPGEGAAITASDLTFGQVSLTAQKAAQLGILSTELNEDSVISMVDLLARDMARNYAWTEDLSCFLGTGVAGTPTGAGPLTGIITALDDGAKVTTAVGADKWGAVTLQDLLKVQGKAKLYPGFRGRWYVHKYGYNNSILDLLLAAGGTDMRQSEEGGEMMLLGDPVTFTQILPGEGAAVGDMLLVYGDLDLGAYLGTRRQISIRTLTELYAANDQLGVISTMRHDCAIHSVGTSTEAGAIVALIAGADA